MKGPGRQTSGGRDPVAAGGENGRWQGPGGPRGCGGHGAAPAQPLAGEEAVQQRAESRCPSGTGGGARLPKGPPDEKRAVRGGGLRMVKRDGVRRGQRRASRHRRSSPPLPPRPSAHRLPLSPLPLSPVPVSVRGGGTRRPRRGWGGREGSAARPGTASRRRDSLLDVTARTPRRDVTARQHYVTAAPGAEMRALYRLPCAAEGPRGGCSESAAGGERSSRRARGT